MRLPLEVVFKRGAIFLWKAYAKLDDPALAGQTKPKFIVVLFFSTDTLIDAGQAGELEIDKEQFAALYETDGLMYRGCLNDQTMNDLLAKISASRRVVQRVKQMLAS